MSLCDQCHNDLHEPDDCHDVWHPHAVYKFCAKGCAAKFLRQLPDAPAFDLVVLDVLIERMDEKYQTGRTWEQTRPPTNRHR